jgi:adenine-specific DNA-methyltransferase
LKSTFLGHQICQHDTIKNYTLKTENSEVLYEKPFNQSLLKSASEVLEEIDSIKKLNKDRYDRIKVSYKDNKVTVYGITKISIEEGIPANLKYFKTDHVDKFDDQEKLISNKLINHIGEMVELENGIDLSKGNYHLVLTEEELELLTSNEATLQKCEKLYIASDILLTAKQERLIRGSNIDVNIVPDYYFLKELKEVGEI